MALAVSPGGFKVPLHRRCKECHVLFRTRFQQFCVYILEQVEFTPAILVPPLATKCCSAAPMCYKCQCTNLHCNVSQSSSTCPLVEERIQLEKAMGVIKTNPKPTSANGKRLVLMVEARYKLVCQLLAKPQNKTKRPRTVQEVPEKNTKRLKIIEGDSQDNPIVL